jgi:hypothetical protein
MTDEFKILILPAVLNDMPDHKDLVLVITQEEFLRMWRRGQAMVQNQALKGQGIDEQHFTGSTEVS